MHTKTPLPRGANNYPHTHACIDIAFSTAQVPSPWHHQHVDQAASTTDMLTCAALIVSTAAKHTKPHRKQAVSHPPTKTPQHSKTRQQPAVQGKQRWGSGGKPVRGFVCAFTRNRTRPLEHKTV